MSIIRWTPMLDPFEEMDNMLSRFNPSGFSNAFVPAMDVYQTDKSVVAKVALPGIDPKDVKISIANDVLTVEGSAQKETEVDEADYYRKEVRCGSFHRSVALPAAVDGDKAKAVYEDGVLKIDVPKEERVQPKAVKIEVKNKKK
ncbi:MAG: Hsp20/alpha crystallin family protein [Candidatus Komeilibacteria bacterium]